MGEPLHLRAADADREGTADFLGRRCAEGRLNPEELAQRLETVYAALTYGELAAVVSDLPGDPPVRHSRGRRQAPRPVTVSAATFSAMLVVALVIYGLPPVATVSLLVVLAVLAALTVGQPGTPCTIAPYSWWERTRRQSMAISSARWRVRATESNSQHRSVNPRRSTPALRAVGVRRRTVR